MGLTSVSKLKLNNAGFGLIEVMIAAGILAVIAIGFSQVMVNGLHGQNAVEANSDKSNLSSLIQLVVQNNGCTVNVAGPPLLPPFNSTPATLSSQTINFNGNAFIYPNGTNVVALGGTWGNGLTITKLQLKLVAEMVAGTSYIANIHVELTKTAGTTLGSNVLSLDVPIALQGHYTPGPPGPNVQVTGCSALGAGLLSCPAGYTLVGTPSTLEAYCISTSQAPGSYTWNQATQNCYANAGYATSAHLCSVEEWQTACVSGVPSMGHTGVGDWVSGFTYNSSNNVNTIALGQNGFGCSAYPNGTNGWLANYPEGATYSYRCCFK